MNNALKGKKILITYGPTWVALDDMRIISNCSSGHMGRAIITEALKTGAKVTVLEGPGIEPLHDKKATIKKFAFFDEFAKMFRAELKNNHDIVIHAAAVSDFKPVKKSSRKIRSDKQTTLTLIPTEKLIASVKRLAPKSFLVGFKLESTPCTTRLKRAALQAIKTNQCDVLIANSLTHGYTGLMFDHTGALIAQGRSRKIMSRHLITYLRTHWESKT